MQAEIDTSSLRSISNCFDPGFLPFPFNLWNQYMDTHSHMPSFQSSYSYLFWFTTKIVFAYNRKLVNQFTELEIIHKLVVILNIWIFSTGKNRWAKYSWQKKITRVLLYKRSLLFMHNDFSFKGSIIFGTKKKVTIICLNDYLLHPPMVWYLNYNFSFTDIFSVLNELPILEF